jgi:hypothetical protein
MRLYHSTTQDRADKIMVGGFRDNATVIGQDGQLLTANVTDLIDLINLTRELNQKRLDVGLPLANSISLSLYTPRVWVGSFPAIYHKLFDVLYDADKAETQTFIAIDVPLPVRGIASSADTQHVVEIANAHGFTDGIIAKDIATWPATQFWGPAKIWNRYPRTRLELDDIIKLRLAADLALMRKLRERFKQAEMFDDAFEIRVAKILIRHFRVRGLNFRKLLARYKEDRLADQAFVERLKASESEDDDDNFIEPSDQGD